MDEYEQVLIRRSMNDLIDIWEKFLLDEASTVELTDAFIELMKIVDLVAPEQDTP